jgi:prolipoprotein diacylglyceryltransferase
MIAKALWLATWAIVGYGVGYLSGVVIGMLVGYMRADKEIQDERTLIELDDNTEWNIGPWND